MLDLEQLAESGELFDGHYKLMYPLNTDGATADLSSKTYRLYIKINDAKKNYK